jgi:sialate O-acetylesterase
MRIRLAPSLGFLLVLVLLAQVHAAVWLGPPFTDHAVLQRGKPVPVWGRAEPGEKIRVHFLDQAVDTTAAADGRWAVSLAPMEASARGADLEVRGADTVTLHDVVVGEVWLASGQSNMEMVVDYPAYPQFRVLNAAAEAEAARFPLIREFKVAKICGPRPNDVVSEAWQCCAPDTVALFSATGFFFARELHRKLNVPVGIINSAYGATPIETWMSRTSLQEEPGFAAVRERWSRALEDYAAKWKAYDAWAERRARAGNGERTADVELGQQPSLRPPSEAFGPDTPSGLYEGMIQPLVPYAVRGFLWYQGEANVGRYAEYDRLLAALIRGWRRSFAQGDLPFFWVQLPSFSPRGDALGTSWPLMREAQSRVLTLPSTGQAVTIDIGDARIIHPPNKQEVGRRLALLAEARAYGYDVPCTGPVFAGSTVEGGGIRARFTSITGKLASRDGILRGFEVAGSDRRFHDAIAEVAGESVLARSPEVKAPAALRYAWHNDPTATLTDDSRLPAAPFRSDNW